jgi:hypothetical protein
MPRRPLLERKTKPNATKEVPAVLDQVISQGVVSRGWGAVRRYLTKHRDLAPLLPAICARTRKTFGARAELALEVYQDREIDDRCLTLFVRKDPYPRDTLARIEGINERSNRRLEQVSGYFLVATDFRKPWGTDDL